MKRQSIEAIIVEYQSPDRTTRCINSLLAQAIDKIHIIDNSSDAGATRSILKNAFPFDDRINIVDATINKGFAAAINIGMQLCTSTFVLVINNDATPEAGAIESLRKKLSEHQEAIASFPALLHSGQPMQRIFYHTWLTTITSRKLPGSYEVPRGCCMLIARERLKQTQLFDERFFMYGEELELGWRHRNKVDAFIFARDAKVIHEGSASSVRDSAFYEERTALAHLLLSNIFYAPGLFGALRNATRLAAVFVRAVIRSMRQRSSVPLHSLRKARHHAQDQRRPLTPPPFKKERGNSE